jgi:CheY-like chemotaxis protein
MIGSLVSTQISGGIGSLPGVAPGERPQPKAAVRNRLILIVEDDFILRSALSELLRDEGYAIECAANGVEALRRVLRTPRPALVLLDIMLPHMDGLTFRATQLALPIVADIPVIVISAAGPGRGGAGLAFAHIFMKPIDTPRLLSSIREIIETDPSAV